MQPPVEAKNKGTAHAGPVAVSALVPYLTTHFEARVYRKRGRSTMFQPWKRRYVKLKANVMLIFKLKGSQSRVLPHEDELYEEAISLYGFMVDTKVDMKPKTQRHHKVLLLSHPTSKTKRYYFSGPSQTIDVLKKHLLRSFSIVKMGDFKWVRHISTGAYGEVGLVQHKSSGELLAMKVMRKDVDSLNESLSSGFHGETKRHRTAPIAIKHIIQERAALEHCAGHPNIIRLRYAFQDWKQWYLITEYYSGGEMFTLRLRQPTYRFPVSVVRMWAAQLISAIQLLHRHGIVHRDLKLENLLLDDQLHVQLSDLGLCKNLEVWSLSSAAVPPLQSFNSPSLDLCSMPSKDLTPGSSKTQTQSEATAKQRRPDGLQRSYSFCGTSEYISPEMIVSALRPGQTYSYEVDWWALGIILYELLVGNIPFSAPDTMQLYTKILRSPVQWPANLDVPPDCKDFVSGLLHKHPDKRFGASSRGYEDEDEKVIRRHPFFKDIDWDKVERGCLPAIILSGMDASQEKKIADGKDVMSNKSSVACFHSRKSVNVDHVEVDYVEEFTENETDIEMNQDSAAWKIRLDGFSFCLPKQMLQEDETPADEDSDRESVIIIDTYGTTSPCSTMTEAMTQLAICPRGSHLSTESQEPAMPSFVREASLGMPLEPSPISKSVFDSDSGRESPLTVLGALNASNSNPASASPVLRGLQQPKDPRRRMVTNTNTYSCSPISRSSPPLNTRVSTGDINKKREKLTALSVSLGPSHRSPSFPAPKPSPPSDPNV